MSGGFSCGIWYRGSRRIVVLPVPSSFDNERGIYCEMGSGNIDRRSIGLSEFPTTLAMLLGNDGVTDQEVGRNETGNVRIT